MRGLPRAVWALGIVSLCMDLSSEMIHGLLPAFIAVELGMGTLALGLVEGTAEAIASFMKVFSGTLSDRSGRRKRLALFGYGLAAASKPLFALATSIAPLVAARCIDRVGKGIRGAPRDALVADVTPPEVRGAAYGLRQALDSIGAVLGPGVAIALMIATGDRFSFVFWIAVIPAVVAVLVLALGVREPERSGTPAVRAGPKLVEMRTLGRAAWIVVALASLLALARFTEAFLVLSLLDRGLAPAWSPVALVAMNAVYAGLSFPAGRLADRMDRRRLLVLGAAVLCAAHAVLAMGGALALGFVGIALYGVHMAITQGLLSAWLSSVAPADARGTAFGVLHFATGVATLAAGALAGLVWALSDGRTTFALGAGLAVLVIAVALALGRKA
jgi:MFS family permease